MTEDNFPADHEPDAHGFVPPEARLGEQADGTPAAPSDRVESNISPDAGETSSAPAPEGHHFSTQPDPRAGHGVDQSTFGAPSPAPWTPPQEAAPFPSPDDDEKLRAERARRFGAHTPAEAGHERAGAQPHDGAGAQPPFDTSGEPMRPGGADAAPLHPQHAGPHDSPEGQPAYVTPRPATPAGPPFDTGAMPPVQPGAYPATTPMPTDATAPAPAEDPFSEVQEAPASRAAAHWWSILISLIFVPVSWYLITDGGERAAFSLEQSGTISVASYLELGAGLLAAFIFLLAARWSSLGAFIMGSLYFALGVAYYALPAQSSELLSNSQQVFGRLGQFGVNVMQHLESTLTSGRMVFYGFVLIMVGVVSHGARRQGRREERIKIALGE